MNSIYSLLNNNSEYRRLFNEVYNQGIFDGNALFLNHDERYKLVIDIVKGARWIIVGDSGSGKSYLLAIILGQFKNVWMFDPTGGLKDTLVEQYKKAKFKRSDLNKDWEFLEITKKKSDNRFCINVCDLHSRCVDIIFPMADQGSASKIGNRQKLLDFFELAKEEKTYRAFEDLCGTKLRYVLEELNIILDKKDKAPSIVELYYGRKIIDIEGIGVRNFCIGALLQSLIGERLELNVQERLDYKNFLVVGMDEAQRNCRNGTSVGDSFAQLGLECRKFGLASVLCGSAYNKLHSDVRNAWNLAFVLSSKSLTSKYRNEVINIFENEWKMLPDNGCFLFSKDGFYTGPEDKYFVVPSLEFFRCRKERLKHSDVVEKNGTGFCFSPNIFG